MPSMKNVLNMWDTVREIDLRPIRTAAEKPIEIAIAGQPGSGRDALAGRLQVDPMRPDAASLPHLSVSLPILEQVSETAALTIILVDAGLEDSKEEQELARNLENLRRKSLVLIHNTEALPAGQVMAGLGNWGHTRLLYGSITNLEFVRKEFIPAVLNLLPDDHLALGRQLPLFRVPIARNLINDTCVTNAAYSLSTGLAEIIPGLGIPLNVTDMVILTKAQAFLVYKLGLVFGFSTQWKDYIAEFGSVIGGGFLWRQIARSLVGLIPVWEIVPKVAVAYSGTFVVGEAVLRWYLTGRHITKGQMKELYAQAAARGKAFAGAFASSMRRKKNPRLKEGKKKKAAALPPVDLKACPNCGKTNPAEANFCQACGTAFTPSELSETSV